jgi:CRISPR system Cascade subunit CasA
MPRRIRLEFAENSTREPCAITGKPDLHVVTSYRAKNLGTKYEGFEHPLTPHYKPKQDAAQWLPTHSQPGGVGYRHWVALTQGERESSRPAKAVLQARGRLIDLADDASHGRRARLLAHGFDMDNMKARGFVESEMPLYLPQSQNLFEDLCRQFIAAANETASLLVGSARAALFNEKSGVKADRELFASLRERFYSETEKDFFALLDRVATRLSSGAKPDFFAETAMQWLERLRGIARTLFEEIAPLDADATKNMARLIDARKGLNLALQGYGPRGAKLFEALQLPVPETKGTRKRRKEAA